MTTKKPRLGTDPLKEPLPWIKDSREEKPPRQKTSKPAKQQASMTAKQRPKKATFYIDPTRIKRLKLLGVEKERDLSALVNEAIEDLLKKHGQ